METAPMLCRASLRRLPNNGDRSGLRNWWLLRRSLKSKPPQRISSTDWIPNPEAAGRRLPPPLGSLCKCWEWAIS